MANANKIKATDIDFSASPGWSINTFLKGDGTFALPASTGVSGSGTTNFYGRWTTSSNIGIGGLQSSSDGLSLGLNVSPLNTFDIYFNSNASSLILFNNTVAHTASNGGGLLFSNNNLGVINKESGGNLDLMTGGFVPRIRITSTGLIGVNEFSPSSLFQITATGFSYNDQFRLTSNGGSHSWNLLCRGDSFGILNFHNQQTSLIPLTLKPNGNVGIGIEDPQAPLHVVGSLLARTAISTDGSVGVVNGNSSRTGYFEWHRPGGLRTAYLGFDLGIHLGLALENSANFIVTGGSLCVGNISDLSPTPSLTVIRNNSQEIVGLFRGTQSAGNITVSISNTSLNGSSTLGFSNTGSIQNAFIRKYSFSAAGTPDELHVFNGGKTKLFGNSVETITVIDNGVGINNSSPSSYLTINEPGLASVFDVQTTGIRTRRPGTSTFTSHPWKLGQFVATSGHSLIQAYLEVEVNGVFYKVALINNV